MGHKKFSFFKRTADGNSADSIEANYKFVPNDKHIVIHCERTCCYYVFSDCEPLVNFLTAQKRDNPELLNFYEVICGQSYQKLRFNVDAPVEFLEQIMTKFEKPKLKAKPAKPEPTGLELIDNLELGLYEENLAKVRCYNDYVNNTSLNMWRSFHITSHLIYKLSIIVFAPEVYNGASSGINWNYKCGHIIATLHSNVTVYGLGDIYMYLHGHS